MEEDDWIDMTKIPRITTEGATTEGTLGAPRGGDAKNEGAGAEHDAEADQAAETEHAAEAKHPDEVERAVEAEHASPWVDASSGAEPTNAEVAAAGLEEQVEEPMREAKGGGADDEAHAFELESVLLTTSFADNETNVNPVETDPLWQLLPKLRCEGLKLK
jgi:hypothetical protein